MTEALHERYVPVLRYAQGERFYPTRVDDFLDYCTLRQKGRADPLLELGSVTPPDLARAYEKDLDLFLQSVPARLADQDVVAEWCGDTLDALATLSYRATHWQAELARTAYEWLSPKTEAATQLFWWNNLVMPLVGLGKRSTTDLPRLSLPPEIRQAAVEQYERSQPDRPQHTYYHRTTRDARYLCLQYWFFYTFNDWATGFGGMNDHEGDWEGLYLFFGLDPSGRPQEPPAYITYVGHHSRLTKPWGHPDVTLEGTHPVAYVAAGSHATYPERKCYELVKIYGLVDYATGDGLTIGPSDWRYREELDGQPWTQAFLGGWGTRYWLPLSWAKRTLQLLQSKVDEFGLPGISAPRGPRYGDDGSVRPNWTGAVSWAGIFDLEKALTKLKQRKE